MPDSWEQVDVFPAIARIIRSESTLTPGFVVHDVIVKNLLVDPEAASIIAPARDQGDESKSAEWIAHNMVAWFSQRITIGESDWGREFERQKIEGKWAYRPKMSDSN